LLPVTRGAATEGDASVTRFLLFGKLKPYKGVDLLIEAFAALPAEAKAKAKLLIVGEPLMDLQPLQARASELGIASHIEWDLRFVPQEEIGSVMQRGDVLAFPYRDIDASGVLMSCLPFGKPIIASRLGAFAALLKEGEHGYLVTPNTVIELTAAMAGLLADPQRARAMGQNVLGLVDCLPSWHDIAERTIEVYDRAIRRAA
jgi:glycosyltransferase involved in cell wall biosynthesis